jgi:arsenite methyltransferase
MIRPKRGPRGSYGIDGGLNAVGGLLAMGAGGLALAVLAVTRARAGHLVTAGYFLLGALLLFQTVASFLYSTTAGKRIAWSRLLDELPWRGDERVLDMGCGRGAILCLVAQRVPQGRAVGLDLWRTVDQTGNSLRAAQRNLEVEGVSDRCELQTGDMVTLPFPDGTFDLVVSSLAIHNVPSGAGRIRAIDEAVRVLKAGGRLLVGDLMLTRAYAGYLRRRGVPATWRRPGWRFWYGMLGGVTGFVIATKPR